MPLLRERILVRTNTIDLLVGFYCLELDLLIPANVGEESGRQSRALDLFLRRLLPRLADAVGALLFRRQSFNSPCTRLALTFRRGPAYRYFPKGAGVTSNFRPKENIVRSGSCHQAHTTKGSSCPCAVSHFNERIVIESFKTGLKGNVVDEGRMGSELTPPNTTFVVLRSNLTLLVRPHDPIV